jgi:pimeloyl-ACP methyl ester carboxylesterase
MHAAHPPPDVPGASHRNVSIQTADSGPIDLHALEAGQGPAVLLLHGWPQHAWLWRSVIPALAGNFRVIAPDLRGFGWSACPGRGYDPVTFATDSFALLDALEIDDVRVAGHDWGGSAAFVMALTSPERVKRLLVANTVAPWARVTPAVLAGAWRLWYVFALAAAGERVARSRPERLAAAIRGDAVHKDRFTAADALAYTRPLAEPGPALATKLLYRMYVRALAGRRPDAGVARTRLTQPAHFLFGARDRAIPPALLDGVERQADQLEVELVEDSGHFICDEKPELVALRARELFTS